MYLTTLAQIAIYNTAVEEINSLNLSLSPKDEQKLVKGIQEKVPVSYIVADIIKDTFKSFNPAAARQQLENELQEKVAAREAADRASYQQWWEDQWQQQELEFPGARLLLSDRAKQLLRERKQENIRQLEAAEKEIKDAARRTAAAQRASLASKSKERLQVKEILDKYIG